MGNEIALATESVSVGLPSLSILWGYARHVNALPMLSVEREIECARSLRDSGSLEAAKELIMSHLRLVVKIAREHAGYGLAQEDLIQEGNVGLMRAVKKFDPEQGVRLSVYAAIWIKSEIQEYILANWRLVKIGSAKGLKKLFFNLRKLQETLHGQSRLRQKEEIARLLGVDREEVERAVQWFAGGEVSLLEGAPDDEEGASLGFVLPAPTADEPEGQAQARERDEMLPARLGSALASLSERERAIVRGRYLNEAGAATLSELACQWGVSLERIRQIEAAALKKIRTADPGLRSFL